MCKSYLFQKLHRFFLCTLLIHSGNLCRSQNDIVKYCHMWKKLIALENHTYFLSKSCQVLFIVVNSLTFKTNLSALYSFKTVDTSKQCGLAATARSNQNYYFAPVQFKAHTVKYRCLAVIVFYNIFYFQ